MARKRSERKEAFNTRIDSGLLRGAKMLAISQKKTFAEIHEEALFDLMMKYGREDLIQKDTREGRLF